MKRGDIVAVPDETNERNRRLGLPYFKVQEVLAILEPGERACDHGFHDAGVGYLNSGERRVLRNNRVESQLDRNRFFWPFKHPPALSP